PSLLHFSPFVCPGLVELGPSFPAAFPRTHPMKVITALRSIGFSHVEETACALDELIRERTIHLAKAHDVVISTSCPDIVELVQKDYPQAAPALAPFPSPMLSHGVRLKRKYGTDAAVVFIGPCLAKKRQVASMRELVTSGDATSSAELREAGKPVDVCLTFAELRTWLNESVGDLDPLPPGKWDAEAPPGVKLAVLQEGISGIDCCRRFLERFVSEEEREKQGGTPALGDTPCFVELLACPGGCLNGPGMGDVDTNETHVKSEISSEDELRERLVARRQRVIEYVYAESRGVKSQRILPHQRC
ncbi:MAG: hypothetical protein NUW12_10260, partial [Firmicutes bacterium]|nr:hypothetical protein [Bacillota bacterium]